MARTASRSAKFCRSTPLGFGIVDRDAAAADPRGGELAVEGGAEHRGLLVVGVGVARPAGFGGAAEPVIGARQRQRPVGDLGDPRKMRGRRLRIVEAAQRIPAGVEFGVDDVVGLFGRMRRDEPVGGLDVAMVDKLARQHPPLGPPFIGIDQRGLVARRLQHDCGGLGELLGAPQIFGLGEEIAGRALRGGTASSSLPAFLSPRSTAAQASASSLAPASPATRSADFGRSA